MKPRRKKGEPYVNINNDFIKDDNGCWNWRWNKNLDGYGIFRINKKS